LELFVRSFALLLSFLAIFTYATFLPALAAATFSTDATGHGAVQGQVPVNKIGALLLADTIAMISNQTMEVKSNNSSNNGQSLLSGQIFNAQQMPGGGIKGSVIFTAGARLAELCKKGGMERVQTSSGDIIEGQIAGVSADGLDVTMSNGTTRHVDGGSLKCIDAPCAFEFNIASGGSRMAFSHCTLASVVQVKQPKQHVSTGGSDRMRKIVLTSVIVLAIATAIAVPIAVGVGTHHRHRHNRRDTDFVTQTYIREQVEAGRLSPVFLAL
jgi:hypothetical protein